MDVDLAQGVLLARTRAPAGARYILSGRWASVRDLAHAAEAVTGVAAPRLVCPLPVARMVAPLSMLVSSLIGLRPIFTPVALDTLCVGRNISHDRATRELGYRARPLHETIEDTYAWFAQEGRLGVALPRLPMEAA